MKIGFILACHNRVDDLLLHLETFKYCPFNHEIIIIHTMDYDEIYMKEIKKYHHVRIEGYGHYIGPLLCATAGVRKAAELGLDYCVFRNADDILYNFSFEQDNFNKMSEGYLCGGYNWLNVGTYYDITLNQVYFDVSAFGQTVDDAEAYFKRSPPGYLCEYKLPRWVKRTCPNIEKQFYRLPNREQEPGIGWERKDIPNAFAAKKIKMPLGFWEKLENNNRFFNLKWQLIGSHDVGARLNYWRKIRKLVSYGKQIEKEHHFCKFLDCARSGKPWNLSSEADSPKPISDKQPKIFSRKIF